MYAIQGLAVCRAVIGPMLSSRVPRSATATCCGSRRSALRAASPKLHIRHRKQTVRACADRRDMGQCTRQDACEIEARGAAFGLFEVVGLFRRICGGDTTRPEISE